jgi:hypothetical protein
MIPRQQWFINRIQEAINTLQTLNTSDWPTYKDAAHEIACELLYATTEWDKYYRDINGKYK